MRRRLAIVLVFVLVAGCGRRPEPDGLKCKVIKIVDGDTIDVLDASNQSHRIRLQGIDAPEDGQPFGTFSGQHLNDLLYGRDVVLQGDKVDRNRRMVCKVLIDGRDANLEQVDAGFAWFYRQYENELSIEDRQRYSTCGESSAQCEERPLERPGADTALGVSPSWRRHIIVSVAATKCERDEITERLHHRESA